LNPGFGWQDDGGQRFRVIFGGMALRGGSGTAGVASTVWDFDSCGGAASDAAACVALSGTATGVVLSALSRAKARIVYVLL